MSHVSDRDSKIRVDRLLRAFTEMAKVSTAIEQNRDAVEVLSAFGLSKILDIEFLTGLSLASMGFRSESSTEPKMFPVDSWRIMISCVEPLEALTIPKELKGEKVPEDILSFEIRYVENHKPTIADLSKATELLQQLYTAVARIYGKPTEERLAIVKVESGSSIRIDCKGVAELVKHLKDFFIEAWNKLRYKRAEEVAINNKAVLSTLAVMDEIDAREKKGSLAPEEAERIRKDMLHATFGLFERCALLSDIPERETVDNTRLLSSFNPKLLPAPEPKPAEKVAKAPETPKQPKVGKQSKRKRK